LKKEEIGKKVGRVIGRYKMGKHFTVTIGEGTFSYERNRMKIEQEAALDGIYVIRTSEPAKALSAEDTVRSYKNLTQVERAFRSLKGIDLLIRPIWHHTEDHARAHLFICMLAYYVERHMRKALLPSCLTMKNWMKIGRPGTRSSLPGHPFQQKRRKGRSSHRKVLWFIVLIRS